MKPIIIIFIVLGVIGIGVLLFFVLRKKEEDNTDVQLTSLTTTRTAGTEYYQTNPKVALTYIKKQNDFPTTLLNSNVNETICPKTIEKDHYKSTCEWSTLAEAKTNCDNMDGNDGNNPCVGFFEDDNKFYAISKPSKKVFYYNDRGQSIYGN